MHHLAEAMLAFRRAARLRARLLLAVGLFALALAFRIALFPLGVDSPFAAFYPAVMLAFVAGGPLPGALCTLLGLACGWTVVDPRVWAWRVHAPAPAALGFFLVNCGAIGLMAHWLYENHRMALAREQRYLSYLSDQTELICRFRSSGELVYANPAFCRYFGLDPDSAIGRTWLPLAHPDDVGRVRETLAGLTPERPTAQVENRLLLPGGEVRWGQFSNTAVFAADGRLVEIQSVGRDITERKRLEADVAAGRREIEVLYDMAPCGYHSLAPDGTLRMINQTELDWLGLTREEAIGRPIADFFTDEGRAQFAASFPRFLARGSIANLEFELCARDGTRRTVLLSAQAMRDADGRVGSSRSVMHDITDLKLARASLQEHQYRLRAISQNALVAIAVSRRSDFVILEANRAFCDLFGHAEHDLVGKSCVSLGIWANPAERAFMLAQIETTGALRDFHASFRRGSGELGTAICSSAAVRLDGVDCLVTSMVDISESERQRMRLERSEELMKRLFAVSPSGLALFDRERRLLDYNQEFVRCLDYPASLLGQQAVTLDTLVTYNHARGDYPGISAEEAVARFAIRGTLREPDHYQVRTTRGKTLEVHTVPVASVGTLMSCTDVTVLAQAEETMRQLALFDPLTGLANRRLLADRIGQIRRLGERVPTWMALMLVDLDDFKAVNDRHGHEAGDQLLVEVARRLSASVRAADTVARLGGDEFVVVLAGLTGPGPAARSEAASRAERLLASVQRPVRLLPDPEDADRGVDLPCRCSIGLVVVEAVQADSRDLLRHADDAMYRAKFGGGAQVVPHGASEGAVAG